MRGEVSKKRRISATIKSISIIKLLKPFFKPLFSALILFVLIFGCRPLDDYSAEKETQRQPQSFQIAPDTIVVSISLPPKTIALIGIPNALLNNIFYSFKNPIEQRQIVTRRVPAVNQDMVLFHSIIYLDQNGSRREEQRFLLRKEYDTFNFKYDTARVLSELDTNSVPVKVDFFPSFNDWQMRLPADTMPLDKKWLLFQHRHDSIRMRIEDEAPWKHAYLHALNDNLLYASQLFTLSEVSDKVSIINKISNPIMEPTLTVSVRQVAMDMLNSQLLPPIESLQQEVISELIPIAIFEAVKQGGFADTSSFRPQAVEWLKGSKWYQRNKEFAEKGLAGITDYAFRTHLMALTLEDTSLQKTKFLTVLDSLESDYYLFDFWATWCKPCIQGIKEMKELDLPTRVKVINISLDKDSASKKWRDLSQKLEIAKDYRIKEDKHLKAFVELMDLRAIPRYVLVDKNLQIVSQKLPAPHDPAFIEQLARLR